ncbi:MAG TPA: glycerol-3-phosphate responsive antiterminator [Tepiditoga sp.]|nr:glycerol-3-phosphate responsive antiterminator [Thermotogota bacterium]HOO75518.1 glycerol-3-phosphate responsive antiterminator [Tepiditoga sp.]
MIKCSGSNLIIPAIRDLDDFNYSMLTDSKYIFLLCGSIMDLDYLSKKSSEYGKKLIVNLDLVSGIASDKKAVEYLYSKKFCDGIISTKTSLIQAAKKLDILTVQRVFMIDSISLKNLENTIINNRPDVIEILPSVAAPFFVEEYSKINMPVIAGGLIKSKEQINDLFKVGITGISTSKKELWNM